MAYGNLKADNLIYADSTTGADTVVPLEHVGGKAPLASPTFTGNVVLPATTEAGAMVFTAPPTITSTVLAVSTDTTQVATTAFVQDVVADSVANLVDSAPATLDTLNEIAAALGDDANYAASVTTSLGEKLPYTGGTLTGDLVLSGDPDAALKAATKQYVDANAGASIGLAVALG